MTMTDEPYLVINWPNPREADTPLAVEIAEVLFQVAGTTAPNAAIAAWTFEREELGVCAAGVELIRGDRKAAVVWHDLDHTIEAAFGWKPAQVPDLDIQIEPWTTYGLQEVEAINAPSGRRSRRLTGSACRVAQTPIVAAYCSRPLL
jgi:hypothetical protein